MSQVLVSDVCLSPPAWQLPASPVYVAVVVAVGSLVVMEAAKDGVAVNAEASLMALPLIRRELRANDVVRSAWRPCATVHVVTTGRGAIARGATAPMAPLLRRQKGRADPVGTVSPDMTWSETLLSFGSFPSGQARDQGSLL